MSWVSSLCALYDTNAWRAGEVEMWNGKPLTLIPLGYDTMKAQIEIVINVDGNFISARTLNKSESETIVPYPEGRTSGIKALPLCDSLSYIAGDFTDKVTLYFDSKTTEKQRKRKMDDITKSFPTYLEGLSAWCSSEYAHPKVTSIYNYISKKNTIDDLTRNKVLTLDDDGVISDKVKILGTRIEKTFVRFRVYMNDTQQTNALCNADNSDVSAVWLDKTVQHSFISYYLSIAKKLDLCYLTGEHILIAKTNPVKIRGEWDTKAKLISSNDDENFSYRGRFNTKDKDTGYNEAMSIGYENSQKIHNALKWIVRRQGYTRDGVCIVTWESALNDMPNYYDSTVSMLGPLSDSIEEAEITDDMLFGEEEAETSETNYASAREFNTAIGGYAAKSYDTSNMVIIALDSATPGRLAMTYYKELETSRYLENIRIWHESCRWRHEYLKDKKYCQYEGMASISEIAKAIYGTEQGKDTKSKHLVLRTNGDKQNPKAPMLVFAFDRLRPCIIDGAVIPHDMIRAAVRKASNPLAYEKEFNYQRVLHIACSLVKRHHWEKGVIFDMGLDKNCIDRSYLYGRLLPIAEKVERSTYEKGETRATNAERYMQQFSRTPFRTWGIIRKSTQIYLMQLKPGSREFYKNLYGEIAGLFAEGDFEAKATLDGKYLLGYDCQRISLKSRKSDGTIATSEDENENIETEEK
ncbi:MAG: type I-C CRISPR-associated protein Cas8c/Csd1 [Desulfosporosinus sp.]|nr:type I-C CRISPR-associated protein Cas8c/Csd1 [Desulfosporosinus sp.]